MNTHRFLSVLTSLLLLSALITSCSGGAGNGEKIVLITTSLGDLKVRLYDETPIHRDNFIRLVNSKYYEGISFHRVIKGFMIQAGDAMTKGDPDYNESDTINSYTLPAEFNPALFHKRGALAAARMGNDVNPRMRSSGTQFYIVQGVRLSLEELDAMEARIAGNIRQARLISIMSHLTDSLKQAGSSLGNDQIQEMAFLRLYNLPEMKEEYRIPGPRRAVYTSIGGVPRLDGTYTVFGEVIEGMEIADKIADAQTDENDRPVTDIKILKMKLVKK